MLNKVVIQGRLTADPQLKYTPKQTPYVRFILATEESYKTATGEKIAHFIPCLLWKKRAETFSKYCKKGQMIIIDGSLSTSSYEKEGRKYYSTDVRVEQFHFTGSGGRTVDVEQPTTEEEEPTPSSPIDFGDIDQMEEPDLPF